MEPITPSSLVWIALFVISMVCAGINGFKLLEARKNVYEFSRGKNFCF